MQEFVGYKDPIGDGLYNMGLTDEEVIRCRDCEHRRDSGEGFDVCGRGWVVGYDCESGRERTLMSAEKRASS